MKSTNYEAPRYAVFSRLISLLWSQHSPWYTVLDHPQSIAQFWLSGFGHIMNWSWGTGWHGWSSDFLRGGWARDRILVRGEIFYTHTDWPCSYSASCTICFLGVRQLECGINHPPTSSTKVKETVELNLYSPSGPSWSVVSWKLLFMFLPWVEVLSVFWHTFQSPSSGWMSLMENVFWYVDLAAVASVAL